MAIFAPGATSPYDRVRFAGKAASYARRLPGSASRLGKADRLRGMPIIWPVRRVISRLSFHAGIIDISPALVTLLARWSAPKVRLTLRKSTQASISSVYMSKAHTTGGAE